MLVPGVPDFDPEIAQKQLREAVITKSGDLVKIAAKTGGYILRQKTGQCYYPVTKYIKNTLILII
ncbi:hypothetical protein [Photorhabdus heterorhabditis]|uniref:Uncharacterized protein n=1 Tax=Photorhabdus heterorhabditis TaxID=880156 RepID=A0A5B0V8I8_9GAMM|nr:hypothetical protein F0L16_22155 [Photorhabdus heterorhabditis]